MYVLILIFGAVGGDPALAAVTDQTLNPVRHATLTDCQNAGKRWKAAAANKIDPDTGIRAITGTYCMKVH